MTDTLTIFSGTANPELAPACVGLGACNEARRVVTAASVKFRMTVRESAHLSSPITRNSGSRVGISFAACGGWSSTVNKEMERKADTCYVIKVVLGAATALLVLATWLVHPAMSGEVESAGRVLVGLLMSAIVVAALLALLLRGNSNSKSG